MFATADGIETEKNHGIVAHLIL
eukprot:SAG31_NODE_14910_length_781_cov_1.118768_1_plen_22_part_10